ncbi:MAG: diacylglycerol/lipid kinase family protein [Erythrobacter sp.]
MSGPIHEFSHLPRKRADGKPLRRERPAPEGATAGPTVGLIYNPRSHRNKGKDLDSRIAPEVIVAQPRGRSQLPEALARLAERGIDLLVINGGDGTVRDVLTCGEAIFGDDWPAIAVLPKGKTNALTVDLDAPGDWTLQAAIDAFENGRRIPRSPIAITPLDEPGARVLGFILGAGAFTIGTRAGQSAHRLGAFNSLAVGVTTLWGVLQALFGTRANPWRRGVQMDLRLGQSRVPFQHSGKGDPARRQFLLASTLERFPAGLKPFGALRKGLKLAVMDQLDRRTTFLIPAVMLGWASSRLRDRGFHQVSAAQFEMELDDQFILDGEAFPPGRYRVEPGPELEFVAP